MIFVNCIRNPVFLTKLTGGENRGLKILLYGAAYGPQSSMMPLAPTPIMAPKPKIGFSIDSIVGESTNNNNNNSRDNSNELARRVPLRPSAVPAAPPNCLTEPRLLAQLQGAALAALVHRPMPPQPPRDSYPLYPWLLSRHGRIFPHRFPGG